MTPHNVLLDKFDALRDAVDSEFVGRTEEIELMRAGLVAKHNIYLLSDPGDGKTALYNRFFARIDGCVAWSLQFSRHTLPDDVYGPLSIQGLTQDKRRRAWTGYLPEAHVALLDELPRAAEATANGLLEAINENTWNDDGQKKRLNLHIAIAAANTMLQAEHDGLGACADRFMLRHKLTTLTDYNDMVALLGVEFDPSPVPVITWDEIVEAHLQAMDVKIPANVIDKMFELVRKAHDFGATISNRRWRESARVVRAWAWLAGRDEATLADLEGLAYCYWDDPDQIEEITRAVAAIASPGMNKAIEISDGIVTLIEDVEKAMAKPAAERENEGAGILSRIRHAGVDARDASATAGGKAARLLNESLAHLQSLYEKHAPALLGMPTAIPFSVFLDLK